MYVQKRYVASQQMNSVTVFGARFGNRYVYFFAVSFKVNFNYLVLNGMSQGIYTR